jgi:hypothetical protein
MNFPALVFLAALCIICSSSSEARMPRAQSAEERILGAEIIVLVRAKRATLQPDERSESDRLVRVSVLSVLKGGGVESELTLVTSGAVAEQDLNCCVPGVSYLLFAKRGRDVLEVRDGALLMVVKDEKLVVSGSTGPFSAFRVCEGIVQGWPSHGQLTKYDEVVAQIDNAVGKPADSR